jgi:hypothetical protein
MAITRDDFKNVPSSGIIPSDRVPASEFAVSYAFTYIGTPSLSTFDHTFSGKIVLHFLDGAGTVKYVIEIDETYNLFIFLLAPGLVLYTWNWVPTAEKISGRKGVDENSPPMATLGLATFGVEPAEGSGTTDREVIVDSRFYSGIFKETLASGDQVKIVFHNLSAGFVVDRASLSLATEKLLRLLDVTLGHFSEIVAARPLGGRAGASAIQGGHSWEHHKTLTAHGFIHNASQPSLLMLPDGREILGVMLPDGFYEYESLDTQRRWNKVLYPATDGSTNAQPAAVFSGEVTMPQLVSLDFQTRLALAQRGSTLVTRRVSDVGLGNEVTVSNSATDAAYSLVVGDDGLVSICNESGLPVFESSDGGLLWTAATPVSG